MKVIKDTESLEFKPFKLVIEVETREDLVNLWCRFNKNDDEFFDKGNLLKDKYSNVYTTTDVWEYLDAEAKTRGLK